MHLLNTIALFLCGCFPATPQILPAFVENEKIVVQCKSELPDKANISLKYVTSEKSIACEQVIGGTVCVFNRQSDDLIFRLVLAKGARHEEFAVLLESPEATKNGTVLQPLLVAAITMASSIVGFYARVRHEKKKEIEDSKRSFLFQLKQVYVGLNSGEDAKSLLTVANLFPATVILGANQYPDSSEQLLHLIYQLSKEPTPVPINKAIETRDKFNSVVKPLIVCID